MNVNSCDLTKLGGKLSRLSDTGYLLMYLGFNRHGYYITLQYDGRRCWELVCQNEDISCLKCIFQILYFASTAVYHL
jgi:hypothetical protein